MHSLLWSCFSGTIFHPFPKETTKYHCVALSLSILNAHFFRIIVLQELHLQADYCHTGGGTHMQTRATQ